jgi:hypothetical protein
VTDLKKKQEGIRRKMKGERRIRRRARTETKTKTQSISSKPFLSLSLFLFLSGMDCEGRQGIT